MLSPVTVLTVFALCLVHTAAGYVDFLGLSHAPTRVERPDGMVEWSHDVHHVFPETGTFFKAKYHAVHHRRWHFVELHKHVDFMSAVDCGASDEELHVKGAPASLIAELAKQDYQHTVIVAHPQYHCSEVAIFRRVTNATHDAATGRLSLATTRMSYETVFQDLEFEMETNHLPHRIEHAPVEDNDAAVRRTMMGRPMRAQGWWSKLKKAVSRVVNAVKSVVQKTVQAVTKVVNTVKQWVSNVGTYNADQYKTLQVINYNGDVTKTFQQWNIVGAAQIAGSASLTLSARFYLKIESFKLKDVEAYLAGSFTAGVRAAFSSTAQDGEVDQEISKVNLAAITFTVVSVPIVISPTVPINAGYELAVDGAIATNLLVSASGYLKQGTKYVDGSFQMINEKSFTFVKDFTPRDFKYEVGIQAYVEVEPSLAINFLGGTTASLKLSGEALVQQNGACRLFLQMNIQPVITASAEVKIQLLSMTLIDKTWGPQALFSTKTPIYSYCLPTSGSSSSSHYYMVQEGGQGSGNSGPVVTTVATSLSQNFTGTVWHGTSNCAATGGSAQQFSVQFATGSVANSTQLIVTVGRNVSQANGTYQFVNVQQTYEMTTEIVAGMSASLTLVPGTGELGNNDEGSFNYNSSADVNDTVATALAFGVSAGNTRDIWLSSPMVCGNVSLQGQVLNNDNSTFTIFAAGGGEPESLFDQAKPYLVYAPVVGAVVLIAILTAVLVSRRRAARRAAAVNFEAPTGKEQYRVADEKALL